MAVALGVLSWSFWYFEEKPPPVFAIGGMAVIAGAYSFSYGPLNWLITAELFTVGVRGIVCATPVFLIVALETWPALSLTALAVCVASAWWTFLTPQGVRWVWPRSSIGCFKWYGMSYFDAQWVLMHFRVT